MTRILPALVAMLIAASAPPALATPSAPIEVRVVIVTTWEYEPGGKDVMGELKAWKDRWPLPVTLPFPAGNHTLHYDPRSHVLAIVTGMTTTRAAGSVMALGLDPRFDLSHAYWLVAGTAGIDPKLGSIGTPAWARWVVDGDMGTELDLRDAPPDWPTGLLAKERSAPYQQPAPPAQSIEANMAHRLNRSLVDWAYGLSRNVELADDPRTAAVRAAYDGIAAKPPAVIEGDNQTSVRFWYGARMNERARRWVDYWTGGEGVFATAAEEDSGIMQALMQLDGAGRAKLDRVMVLRAASDFTVPPPGTSAVALMTEEAKAGPVGTSQALENLYRTGAPVVRYLADHWAATRNSVPGARP